MTPDAGQYRGADGGAPTNGSQPTHSGESTNGTSLTTAGDVGRLAFARPSAHRDGRAASHPVLVPTPAAPLPEGGSALLDLSLQRDLLLFSVRAVHRHRRATLGAFATILAAAVLALLILPRTYYAETKLLAQRNVVLPVLGNPGRKLPTEADTPTRLASEAILNHKNLRAIVTATGLVQHWQTHRSVSARLRDAVNGWFSAPPTEEQRIDALVWLLNRRMWVNVGEGTVTIGITWYDPDMAYRILTAAQQSFLEERHTEELALISESIVILEQHAADVHTEIKATLDSMARARESVSGGPTSRRVPTMPAVARPGPSAAVLARHDVVRRAIADLEQFRGRRVAELQATLADQRNSFGPAHPQIASTEQMIGALTTDSPQLVQLREEEQALGERLRQMGVGATDRPTSAGGDPLIALAALRSLERLRVDSLMGEKQQYERARLRISIQSYQEMLQRLESARIELQTTQAAFKYKYGVLIPAQTPTAPVTPRPGRVLGGGLVLALLAGVFVAVALDVAGGRALERWQVERLLGLPVLGRAPHA